MLLKTLMVCLILLGCRASYAMPNALVTVPGVGTVITHSNAARYEFGTRLISDDSPLTHIFLLRNSTQSSLTIDRVAASCDCIHADISELHFLPIKVASGKTVPVLVTLTMRRLIPGDVSKSVWLYPRGSKVAAMQLEMHGTVRDASMAAQTGIKSTDKNHIQTRK